MKTTNTMKILGTIGVVAGFLLASSAYAEQYTYVTTNGELRTTNADSPAQAMANASDIALHSGVIEASKSEVMEDTNSNYDGRTYAYVDIYGNVSYVKADSAAEAMTLATNKKANSGVMLVSK